jgi:hypothetical protein
MTAVGCLEEQHVISASLFGGLAGVAFAAWYAAHDRQRYQKLLQKLDGYIFELAAPTIGFFLNQGDTFGAPVQTYDLISGLAGITIYLLGRRGTSDQVELALQSMLQCFVKLAGRRRELPAWHTPKGYSQPHDTMTEAFPDGYLNCGLAHGIPGPLGAMSLAQLSGLKVDGLQEAIHSIANWLLDNRIDDDWGMNWPAGIGLEVCEGGFKAGSASKVSAAHAAWCYGSPGVSRSLFLAGLALNNSAMCAAAAGAITAALSRPKPMRRLHSPTLCHGLAGLLQNALRFYNDAPNIVLMTACRELLEELLSQYDPNTLLGVQSRTHDGTPVDSPGLLDGATGFALALLSVQSRIEPNWDRAFLLS